MHKLERWLKNSLYQVWKGFLNNLVVIVVAILFSGGYLVAINKLKQLQEWIRKIPTDYVLTPLVLLIVIVIVLVWITHKQKIQLSDFRHQTPSDGKNWRFVTHLGVWWKIYGEAEYIEDFPYCPCCEPRKKLVQIEWYPHETFQCPVTKTKIKLYDKIPRERQRVLESLYNAYFDRDGWHLREVLSKQRRKIKDLHPDKSDEQILQMMFEQPPLNKIPQTERNEILNKFSKLEDVFSFLHKNLPEYRRIMLKKGQ
jgi:hypothetical protein